MPKIDSIFKEEIAALSKKELEKLVLKAASANKNFHDYLIVNYINKSYGEQELFEQAKNDLQFLFRKSYKGFSDELQAANMLASCNKRISEFGKICKDKSKEIDLIFFVLTIPFSSSTNHLGTCFTRYDYQVYLLVKKALGIYKTKLHEDYHLEYAPMINRCLEILHSSCSHLDYVYDLPKSVTTNS